MATDYPLPSWIQTHPDDVANKFVSGLQIGATLGEARNRLQQQANQSAVENQLQQDKLTASTIQQTQELQVKKAYEDQQVSLATQKLDAAKQKIGLETMKAARQFQAQQSYQKDYQDALDSGLSKDEAAKGAMFKNLGMFSSGTGAASALRTMAPAKDTALKLQNVGGQDFAVGTGGRFQAIKSDAQIPYSVLTQATTADGKPISGVYVTPKGGIVKTASGASQNKAAIKALEDGKFGLCLTTGRDPKEITPKYTAAKKQYQDLKAGGSGSETPAAQEGLKIKSITAVEP